MLGIYVRVCVRKYVRMYVCMYVRVLVIGVKSANLYVEILIISVNIVCVGLYGDSGSVPCKWLCDEHYPYV